MAGKMNKMPREERAKQFMPFASLRGYGKIVKDKEQVICDRKELSEEDLNNLSNKMREIKKGDIVEITYYLENGYVTEEGAVSKIDFQLRRIFIIKTRIEFDDILDINVTEKG